MELIGTAVDILKFCAPYIKQKLDFVFYKKNVENVKTQMDKLAEKKAEIVERLDLAERRHLHKPKPHVADWLNLVHTLETETSSTDWEEGNRKCFMGLCVNWRSRYKLNKQVRQKASEVKNLIEEMQKFEVNEISTPPLAPMVEKMNISGYMETESLNFLIQKMTDLLESESVKAIGVWGMGGIGKTTLVKTLNNHLKSNSIFDKVILVTISQTPDWRQIHKQIGERIGLNLIDYESEDMRVNMLSMALKKEKSLLFIVDDVWANFQLSLLGIPDEASDAKYKVILTTRSQLVCAQMRIGEREQFELKPMSKDDSWKLFQNNYVGYDDVAIPTTLVPIAIELCDKCGGSPLAICTLSSSLRGEKSRASWNDALKQLTSSDQPQLDGILNPVFTSIEFSFNRLASEAVKLCFLYCCSYPEDSVVLVDDIRTYGISQRLIRETSLKEASERVHAFVEILWKSSLLILADDKDKEHVLVHDIVRQVGIWIASNKYGFVVKSDQQFIELPLDENLLHSKFLSLSDSKFKKLPNMLCCPNLLALDMSDMSCNQNVQIHEEFFTQTTKLTYLDISRIRIGVSNVPKSLYDLINLRALDMRGIRCLLDISSIGKLKCLEILILDDTGIAELPKELGNLNNLRMLQLKNIHKLKRVAPNIFNQLISLQELNMENSFNLWERNGGNGVNCSLSEIFGLSELTTLHLDIIDPLCLQQDYLCPSLSNLEKFKIVVASSEGFTDTESRFVKYLSLAKIPPRFGNWICKLFETCEYLELRESDVVETLPYRQIRVFNYLTKLKISNLRFMKQIIDCQLIASRCENDVFPSLKQLEIKGMDSLEYLCNTIGSATRVLFSKLTHVKIHNCKNLRILFMGSMDQALQNLTELHICHCDELEKLTDVKGSIYFEKIKKIEVQDCGKLETLLAAEAEWEYLENICVSNCRSLKTIFHTSVFPQNLKHLTLENCKKLTTSVFVLIQRSFSRIETIRIVGCNPGNVKYLLSTTEIEDPSNKNVFENLRVLEVSRFNGKGIFHESISQSSLQNLAEVRIAFCNDLTSIWGSSETFALIKPLKYLVIKCCNKLMLRETFLPKGMGEESVLRVENLVFIQLSQLTTLALLPQASLQYVKLLQLSGCKNLKYVLPQCHAGIMKCLHKLVLHDCCNLEMKILQNDAIECDLREQAPNTISEDVLPNNLTCNNQTPSTITDIYVLWIENCSRLDLEKLDITCTRGPELTFKRLSQLETLSQLPSSIVGQQCNIVRVLECENLIKVFSFDEEYDFKRLVIYDCPKLMAFVSEEDIVPSPRTQKQIRVEPINRTFFGSTFRNLNYLFIGDCHNLKNLFSVSIARSLVNLEYMYVVNCEEMREIVAISDLVESEAYYADLFPRLKTVRLFWLPKVECFCRGNPAPLMWQSLKFIMVLESPKLVTMGMGLSSAPDLLRIRGEEKWFENFEKESSFPFSRLRSLFWTITSSDTYKICSTFRRDINSTAYTSKLRKTIGSQKGSLLNEPSTSSLLGSDSTILG